MNPSGDSRVGCVIVAGLVLVPIGLVSTIMVAIGGVFRSAFTRGGDSGPASLLPFTLFLLVLGIGMALGGFLYGYRQGKREYRGTGNAQSFDEVQVHTRFVYNRRGEMVNEEYMWEDGDDHRFYVRILFPNGAIQEYETVKEVFDCCADGIKGTAVVDGRWLGAFSPVIGQSQVQPYTPSV